MQLFLKSQKWHHFNLIKWLTISLNDIILANSNLLTTKCVCKLYIKFDTIQQGINSA